MQEEHLKRQILNHLAEQGVPADYDPWEIIHERLRTARTFGEAQTRPWMAKRRPAGLRTRLVGLAVFLLALMAGAVCYTTPQGRALAQGILRFFAPTQSDPSAGLSTTATPLPLIEVSPTEKPTSMKHASGCSGQFDRDCTLQQAQSLVDFPLLQFQSLPGDLYFKGASVEKGRVTATYECPDGCTLWLEQEKLGGRQVEPAPVGSGALVEPVPVGTAAGEFVEGSYYGADGTWNSDAGVMTLRWQQADILYTLSAVRSETGAEALFQPGKETLVALAENLAPGTPPSQPLNPGYLTTVMDAQTLAGFDLHEPAELPDGYEFSFATFDAQSRFVCLHYTYKGASYPSLFIRESAVAPLTDLQGYPGSRLETTRLEIGGAEGEALFVIGFAAPQGACDRQNNIFRAGQALLWRAKGTSFEIYSEFPSPFGGAGLDQEALVALAEGLRGVSNPPEGRPDRFMTIAEVERAVGYKVRTPTKLPAGSGFELARIIGGSVMSLYSNPGSGAPAISLHQCPTSGEQETPCLTFLAEIPLDFREAARLNGLEAVYAKGSMGRTPEEDGDTWHVQDPALTQRLYWRSDGWDYLMIATGEAIDREVMIAIAESMR